MFKKMLEKLKIATFVMAHKVQIALGDDLNSDYVYYVKFSDIVIPKAFLKTKVNPEKLKRKTEYFYSTGEFESSILINPMNWTLIDGYSSYVIAKRNRMEYVPVYFTKYRRRQ